MKSEVQLKLAQLREAWEKESSALLKAAATALRVQNNTRLNTNEKINLRDKAYKEYLDVKAVTNSEQVLNDLEQLVIADTTII